MSKSVESDNAGEAAPLLQMEGGRWSGRSLSFLDQVSLLFLVEEEEEAGLSAMFRLPGSLRVGERLAATPLRLLQSLALLQQFKALEALGVSKFDAASLFLLPEESVWGKVRVCLYGLCERLTRAETLRLIELMEHTQHPPPPPPNQRVFNDSLLEGFILRWAVCSKLGLIEPLNLSPLSECLRRIKRDDCAAQIDALTGPHLPRPLRALETSDHHSSYPIIDANHLGLFVLFDIREFDSEGDPRRPTFDRREGSEKDADTLSQLMEAFNLKVCLQENVKCGEICPTLRHLLLAQFVPSRHSVVIVSVLSHGVAGGVYGSDCLLLPLQAMVDVFCEPPLSFLKPIPKVIIIQACQGDNYYEYVESDGSPLMPPSVTLHLPNLLFCSSTVYGFRSFRSRTSGTWYIQVLCEELKKSPHDDFLSIVTKVNHRISKMYAPTVVGLKISMLPHFDSTLTKKLYLSF